MELVPGLTVKKASYYFRRDHSTLFHILNAHKANPMTYAAEMHAIRSKLDMGGAA
jgi:hypothetical protein